MSSSINMGKKTLSMDFIKKTAGYITGATGEYINEIMPVTVDTLKEAKATVTQVSSSLSNTTQQVLPKIRNLKTQNPIREIYRWYMDKENEFDDSGLDTNFEFDTDTDESDIAESQISEVESSSNKIAKATIDASKQVVESQFIATANLQSTLDKQSAVITAGFDKTNETLNKILEVVTKNTSTLIESSVAGSDKKDDPVNSMIKNGKFNLKSYKNLVTSKVKNSAEYSMLSMIPMIVSGTGPQDIFKMLLEGAVNKAAPKLKDNVKALDDVINDTIMQSLIRLGNNPNQFSLGGYIGKFFGIDSSRKNQSTERSSLEVKSVSFDTITRESITNTIPGYLRKILVAVGGEDLVYDYRSRSFKSNGDIKKEFTNTAAANGSIYHASSKVRDTIGTDNNSSMFYEMLLADLGSKNNRNNILETFSDPEVLKSYMSDIITTNGIKIDENDLKALDIFSKNFSTLTSSNNGIIDVSMQASKNNIARNVRTSNYITEADRYNIDLSEINDSLHNDIVTIANRNGKKSAEDVSVAPLNPKALTGVNYTNAALYQIFRRLDTGINVFQVGSSDIRKKPYKKFGDNHLAPPARYKPKNINETEDEESTSIITNGILSPTEDQGPNYLQDQVNEDGTPEELTTGQKVGRWAKYRGGMLGRAIFSGSPEQVRAAFGSIITDIGQVTGDQIKKGASQLNTSFGNVTGYLKHKMFGTEYSYQDGVDEDGKPIMKHIAKNDFGGVFGFITDELKESFKSGKNKLSKWTNDIKQYFDYGDSKDPDDKKVASKRKKFILSAVGAYAGAGILGGPIGMVVGALGANALSGLGIGNKIKNLLFGHDSKGKPTGLINRAADAFISPLRFQLGKTVAFAGSVLKKNVFGPLSDIGLALKDRINNHIDSTFEKIKKGAANVFGKIFGTIGKGILKVGTKITTGVGSFLSTTAPGKLIRGAIGAGGAVAGGIQNSVANKLASGKTFHTLKNDETYLLKKGEQYLDTDGSVQTAAYERIITGADGIKVKTSGYLKQRRESRKNEIKKDLEESGYYNSGSKLKGFFGGDYKRWKEQDQEKWSERRSRINQYTNERLKTPEEIEAEKAANETAENTATIAEQTEIAADAAKTLADLGSEQGSIFTHDQGLHDRLDSIINLLEKNNTHKSIDSNNDEFNSSAITAAASFAGSGDEVNDEESRMYTNIIDESSKTNGSKSTVAQKLKELMNIQKKRSDDKSKDEESSFGSKVKEILSKAWPFLLGGLTLLNDDFREFLGDVFSGAANWLTKNLPGIIKGAFNVGETINQEIENQATGATTEIDTVTNESKSVISAEKHSEHIQDGILSSSFDSAINPLRLAKDSAIIAGERAAIKGGSTLAGLAGGATSIAGKAANLGTKIVQGAGSFAQGISQYGLNRTGLNKGAEFFSRSMSLGGSRTAQKVSSAGVAVAKGSKGLSGMLSKAFDVKTWLKPSSVANIVGSVASDVTASVSWDAVENAKNAHIVGDYGLGNAGGFVQSSTTAKTITTTTIGTAGGIAIGAAVGKAATAVTAAITAGATVGSTNVWNPIGWAALIITGVLALSAGLAALINLLVGVFTDNADKDYAIRSNSTKLEGVIKDKVSYTNGKLNPMYVYCAQENDRVLSFTKGMNIKDPELAFGKILKMIANGLSTSPGTEVLLYDFINNMAVQGVPFASLMAGDSEECSINGGNANKDILGDPPITRTGPMGGGYTEVRKSKVRKNKDKVFADIAANISRQDSSCVWSEENLTFVYEAGEKVVKALKSKGIIKDNGTVDIKKFKGTPNSGKNDEGWKALDELTRKNDSYFLTKCLVYINSKIEANKSGEQWLEARKDDIVKLLDGLKDFLIKEKSEMVANLKSQGKSDKEIEQTLAEAVNPKGEKAEESASQISDDSPIAKLIQSSKIRSDEKSDVIKELKLLSASYAYSHPNILQKWVSANKNESGVSVDNQHRISTWKTQFSTDKRLAKILRSEMATAALNFADDQTDIFNLVSKFDWTEGGKIYTGNKKDPGEKYGSGFVIRGEKKKEGEGLLDKLWNGADPISESNTPEDIHKVLFGKNKHGSAAESSSTSKQDWTLGGNGIIARIADMIVKYGSSEGERFTNGSHSDKWRNVLINLPVNNPSNLAVGGPDEGNESISDPETVITDNNTKEGGNPLNKPYRVSSKFGWRDLNGDGVQEDYHRGIDLVPSDNSRKAEVGSRYSGTITSVRSDLPDSHTGLGVSSKTEGNYVTIDTDSGLRVKNMHLKAGSIPSNIKVGARVKVGDKIGDMGTTGRSTGPHLHYQIEKSPFGGDYAINPFSDISGGASVNTINSKTTDSNLTTLSGTTTSNYTNTASITENINTNKATGGLGKLVEIIKEIGSKLLNHITGGLFGSSGDSDTDKLGDSGNSSINVSVAANALATSKCKSVDDFLNIVKKEINTVESPVGSNKVKYNTWFWPTQSNFKNLPWHMAFIQWCFNEAGLPLDCRTNLSSTLLKWYQENHPELIVTTPKPGDIVLFNFDQSGIVEKVLSNNTVKTIEGGVYKTDDSIKARTYSRLDRALPSQTSPFSILDTKLSTKDIAKGVYRKTRSGNVITAFIRAVDFEALEKAAKLAENVSNVGDADGNAKHVYEFLKMYGLPDVNIAGVLGNWTHESGIDPTSVEGIYDEKYYLGPKKISAMSEPEKYTKKLFSMYAKKGLSINQKAYKGEDGVYYPGIGLGGFTGPAVTKLMSFAKKEGKQWYDLQPQLKFSIEKSANGGYRDFMSEWLTPESSPNVAARKFLSDWEGVNPDINWVRLDLRQKVANDYYKKMQNEWKKDLPGGIGGPTNDEQSTFGPSETATKIDRSIPNDIGGPVNDSESSKISESTYVSSNPTVSKSNRPTSTYTSSTTRSTYKAPSHTSVSDNNYTILPTPNIFNDENIVGAIYELLVELRAIRTNTGSSSELLADLNSKEFVDKGLRDSINALGSIRNKSSAAMTAAASKTNTRTINSIVRP